MGNLFYTKESKTPLKLESDIYHTESLYQDEELNKRFLQLKANVCDLNQALVKKCITGTEQDFIMLMDRAKDYVVCSFGDITDEDVQKLLEMFRQCVFGYYILTPLIEAKDVSDIKVLNYNHIVVKANGERYLTDISFFDENDYKNWFERILRIHRLGRAEEFALGHCTDRKGVEKFYLRIDVQLSYVTSTEKNNIHIRKMPKTKLSWDYLKENNMLDDEMIEYLKDRISAGYGFLISGRGGSGKSTLLNNMIDLIPFNQSVLVSQESDELYSNVHPQIQFEHTMTVRKHDVVTDFSLEDELRLGLLQDIDNFIIGEIKGGEALYVFTTAMSTGARFFGTIHSNDAASSVTRLAQCARYVSDYSMETLEEMLTCMPFVLIHMSHFSIDEILEVDGWDEKRSRLNFRSVFKKEDEA
ncbi:ATPase, T2SS/T4P/T4SS family [Lachnospira multipara]|uniref:ATPase, T2SS/T4P/T4SS family n=1 Tax=Lachnospira multipara TaxID=28051 RepID=UPI0004E20894|nr:ATPase, T2SS/T4P/T4SS family [Lachnospira multipara]